MPWAAMEYALSSGLPTRITMDARENVKPTKQRREERWQEGKKEPKHKKARKERSTNGEKAEKLVRCRQQHENSDLLTMF